MTPFVKSDTHLLSSPVDLPAYYGQRAPYYDEMYRRDGAERNHELDLIKTKLIELMRGKDVLEVACGTGHWTWLLEPEVKSLLAIDASEKMLERARLKNLPSEKIEFLRADAYSLPVQEKKFEGAFANFWLSHVPKARLREFLEKMNDSVVPGAPIFLADNMNVPGVGGEFVVPEAGGDTYKRRECEGKEYLVLKNYFSRGELEELFSGQKDLSIEVGSHFWWLNYCATAAPSQVQSLMSKVSKNT